MQLLPIKEKTETPVINIAIDTIERNKQALFFVNSKASAEKTAEEIAKALKNLQIPQHPACKELSQKVSKVLSTPTKQCKRVAACLEYGVAFHHAGLVQKQKTAIEQAFKNGIVRLICATPTLAMGVDLPAYRSVIRDLKRFSQHWGGGMVSIPVLEYHQMAGRAGRPGKDTRGEAITIAKTAEEKDAIYEEYVIGDVEDIYSKLAVEPVLRTYVLSLIAIEFVTTKKQIMDFFSKTFWAHQYHDMKRLEGIIEKMLQHLIDWGFLQTNNNEFTSAADIHNELYKATRLGKRVAELYIDPLTAHQLITAMRKTSSTTSTTISPFTLLQLMSAQLELRPLLTIKKAEYDKVEQTLMQWTLQLLIPEPSTFDPEYDEFLRTIKTAMFFARWIEECSEDLLLKEFNVRPGELHAKKERALWLLYAAAELARLLAFHATEKEFHTLRFRVEYGVKEELFPLLRLKGVGRVRARRMYNNKIKDLGDVKKSDVSVLGQLLGTKMAVEIMKQVGISVDEILPTKRKGQMGLAKYYKKSNIL